MDKKNDIKYAMKWVLFGDTYYHNAGYEGPVNKLKHVRRFAAVYKRKVNAREDVIVEAYIKWFDKHGLLDGRKPNNRYKLTSYIAGILYHTTRDCMKKE